jgi:prepilin-type N-terminal cleavage/methylation domain-containing protein
MKNHGFTFIEIVVVIAVLIIALPSLFSIIFTILQQQTKLNRISVVKREGDYAVNILKNNIRNRAYKLYSNTNTPVNPDDEICSDLSSETPISMFADNNNNWFIFDVIGERIASTSATIIDPLYLTSTQVAISNFDIFCSRSNKFAPATVFISFHVCYKGKALTCPVERAEETASLDYQSYITIRNY